MICNSSLHLFNRRCNIAYSVAEKENIANTQPKILGLSAFNLIFALNVQKI